MASLFERYRPRTWSEVVGQEKLVAKVNALRPRGLGDRAWWIAGPSGAGKTTCGRLIAKEVAAEHAIVELDASELTPPDVRAFQTQFRGKPLGSNGWALLVNEAHGLRRDTIRALLVISKRCRTTSR
jgi:DNA polymerase III subunit gamma/tau